jgi:MYXO-CTERM domain-containing protein
MLTVLRAALVTTVVLSGASWEARAAPEPGSGVARLRPYAGYRYVTALPRDEADVRSIWSVAEYVLAPHDPRLAPHRLAVTRASQRALEALGISVRIEAADMQALVDASFRLGAQPAAPRLAAAPSIFGAFFSRVQPLDAIFAHLDELVQASQGRATLLTIGKTVQGRDIKAVRVSSAQPGAERPSILVTGTHHAREWASPMVVMGLLEALVSQREVDPRVRTVVDNLDVFIVPVVNADGYVASHMGMRLQRKNMNPTCNVDLNRNYDAWWGKGVPVDGCKEETYPGTSVFSEPETRAVADFARARRALRLCFDYHSAASQVGYPFAFTRDKPPGVETDRAWAELYSKTLMGVNGSRLPAVSDYGIGAGEGGSAIDWYRLVFPHSIEVELRDGGSLGGFGISDDLVVPFAEENWAGWLAVALEVVKEAGGSPVDAGERDGAARDAGEVPRDAPVDLVTGAAPDARSGGQDGQALGALDADRGAGTALVDAAVGPRPQAAGCACQTGGARSTPAGILVGIVLAATWRRRQSKPRL